MNNKLINQQQKNIVMSIISFTEKKLEKLNWNLFDFRSDPNPEQDPDPLFPEADPRIRIHIKIKRIRKG